MTKEKKLNIILLISSALISFIMIASGRFVQETYNIKIGQIAPKTVFAPREMQNKIATEQKKEQVAQAIEPHYGIDPRIAEETKESVELLFKYIEAVQSEEVTIYEIEPTEILKERSPVPLYIEQYQFLLDLPVSDQIILKNQILDISEKIYKKGIRNETHSKALMETKELFDQSGLSPAQNKIGNEIVSSLIRPNMEIDLEATEDLIQQAIDKVEPAIILSGEKIIEQGTRITEETYELLKDAGYMNDEASNSFKRYLGVAILIMLLGGMFCGYMIHKKKEIILNSKEKILLFVLYIIAITMTRILVGVKFVYIPMIITPMLATILIHSDIAAILNIIVVIVGALIYKGDIAYALYFIISGIISSIYVVNVRERNRTFAIAIYVGLVNLILIFAIRVFTQGTISISFLIEGVEAFFIGILALIIVVGSLPFWEVAFDIVTPIKLLDLTNPNQPLLKRLLLEATGTYYHSLLVANLAETAANAIGANSLLARVGGYYHDIGKLGYVNYYKENQAVENPHDYLEPEVSSDIILSHVTRGEELATQYKLPKCVKDIIVQHHGTTLAQYFYVRAMNIKSEEEVKKADFQYKGPKPQSKEAAIVMLADVVEATIRSMMPLKKEGESLEKIVENIVRGKLEDGQLDESALMIQDIDKIIQAFIRLLTGMYHERIKYPPKKDGAKE